MVSVSFLRIINTRAVSLISSARRRAVAAAVAVAVAAVEVAPGADEGEASGIEEGSGEEVGLMASEEEAVASVEPSTGPSVPAPLALAPGAGAGAETLSSAWPSCSRTNCEVREANGVKVLETPLPKFARPFVKSMMGFWWEVGGGLRGFFSDDVERGRAERLVMQQIGDAEMGGWERTKEGIKVG